MVNLLTCIVPQKVNPTVDSCQCANHESLRVCKAEGDTKQLCAGLNKIRKNIRKLGEANRSLKNIIKECYMK